MAESVVKYRPAIRSASNFPAAIIRRKAGPVIEPSGKASCAAISNRNGASGAGRSCPVASAVVQFFFGGPGFSAPHRR